MFKRFLKAAVFITALLFGQDSIAALFDDSGAVTQRVGAGEINWTTMAIRAEGSGLPVEDVQNLAVAKLATERNARIDAIRKIIETLHKARLDAKSTVGEFVASSEYASDVLDRIARGARVVEKRYLPEGVVEVVVEAPVAGPFMEALIPQAGELEVSSEGEEIHTGLIVDARGLRLKPALSPKILDASWTELYGASVVSKEFAINRGIVRYEKSLAAAMENEIVADSPLVMKGIRGTSTGGCDVVISSADAAVLRDSSKNRTFLKQGRVIFIID